MSLHGGNPWAAYQGFTRDRSVKQKQLTAGTLKRPRIQKLGDTDPQHLHLDRRQ